MPECVLTHCYSLLAQHWRIYLNNEFVIPWITFNIMLCFRKWSTSSVKSVVSVVKILQIEITLLN